MSKNRLIRVDNPIRNMGMIFTNTKFHKYADKLLRCTRCRRGVAYECYSPRRFEKRTTIMI